MEIPKTEGIKYAGSKLKILPYIFEMVNELKGVETVLDGFSGTTRVSQAFAQLGYSTSSNDISAWSEVFATCYLISDRTDAYYQELIDHLNNLAGVEGWFTENYGGTETQIKKLFQLKNTLKLDAIRDEIDKLNLSWEDKCVLLTSLIYALDKVDSTLGHYAAYLSEWSPRSFNDLKLKLPLRFTLKGKNNVIRDDIFSTVANNRFDLVYFDPPYGSNNEKMPPSRVRYASYYHLWTTIIQHDKPTLFGKANRREDSRDVISPSVFEEFRKSENGDFLAMNALRRLIKETNAHYLLLSYSSGGRATKQQLMDIISESGKLLEIKMINYNKNIMSSMRTTNEWINSDTKHHEYLFLMVQVAPIGGPGEGDDLRTGVVDVILLGDVVPGFVQQVREGVADDRTPAVADVHGAGGVGGDVFHIDFDPGADGGVAVGFCVCQDDGEQSAEALWVEAEVDEAGTGCLGCVYVRTAGQALHQRGGDLGGWLARGFGRDHGGVGGHVAVGLVAGGRDLDPRGDVGREVGDDLCQGGKDGLAQASVEVGRVHGRGISAGWGVGRWLLDNGRLSGELPGSLPASCVSSEAWS